MVIIGIADDVSVAQFDVAAGILGDIRVVGYEDDGSALSVELLEKDKNLETGSRVQVTRCLVGKNHGRIVHQRPGDGYTLHLSTRHLIALMVESLAQSYSLQSFDGTLLALFCADGRIVHQRQLYILYARGFRQEIVVLEDEANLAVAQDGSVVAAHLAHAHAIQVIFTLGRGVETAQLVEQGGFAGTRLTHNGNELALVDLEAYAFQGVDGFITHKKVAAHVVELDHHLLVPVVI